ncbi:MAG: hypothetical protein FWF49_06670 [Oscillospiraceae bacterium]|nr:hypothetical protein [Oscillospiraceae bacterium]
MDIQWYPGHMTKAKRLLQQQKALVDFVLEVRDARVPRSSANPDWEELLGDKPSVVLLNKADMADDAVTRRWLKWLEAQGAPALAGDCKTGAGLAGLAGLAARAQVLAVRLMLWCLPRLPSKSMRIALSACRPIWALGAHHSALSMALRRATLN